MIIELGDLRCGVNETFPGLRGGCLFRKKKRKKRNDKESKRGSETEKEQESVVTLIHTGTQELN